MASPATTYNEWKRSSAVGCVFARAIALRPGDYGEKIQLVASSSPLRVANSFTRRIDRLVEAPEVSAAAVIFPGIQTLRDLLIMVMALKAKPGWAVSLNELTDSQIGPALAVGLSRTIPDGAGGSVPSEVLAFGPFTEMPNTRRAPYVVMELFVGRPQPEDPKTHSKTMKANLAHVEIPGLKEHALRSMWQMSKAGRLASLGGTEDSRAKAKVAFVVPVNLAQSLGYWP